MVPAGADRATPLPLIILLHGYGVTAELQELLFQLSNQADTRGFLYAEPNGAVDRKNKRFWNATDACCNFDHLEVDDVGYLRALVADVKTEHPVDASKVFVIGHSNGGFMALRMACEAGDLIRGVVSVAGSGWLETARCGSGPPVSVLQIHGTSDSVIEYGGGATTLAEYPSARATHLEFAARNGCGGPSEVLGTSDFIEDPAAETTREAATRCPPGRRAELWSIGGGGHIPLVNDAWRSAVLDWMLTEPK